MYRIAILVLLLPVFAACGGTTFVTATTAPVNVPSEYESDRRAAVVRALSAKGYAIQDEAEEASKITAKWANADRFYRVDIDYADDIELTYLDSEIEQKEAGPDGTAPAQYARYMRILRQTIERELGRPMREAAEAEANAADTQERRLAEEKRRQRKVLVTSGAGLDEIRAAIATALTERSYTVEEEEGQVITARWSKGELFYRLSLTYDEREITLQYLDSDKLVDADGVQVVDEKYIDYMGRLQRSIDEEINQSDSGTE